jgi:lysophospholipase L1-like esterase
LLPGLMPGTTVQLLACSGATTKALTGPFKNQPAQADQLRALGTAPTVVTITIGGNDAGFGSTIASCFLWRCFWDGRDDRVRAVVDDQLPGLLQTSYAAVRAAAPNARIVVVGYPKIFPQRTSAACPWMNSTERSQLASLNGDLNRVIRRAASKADLEYISADNALRGHEMCTSEPWVYPVTISTAGSRDSAHPTPAGEQAIAKVVQTYLAKPR